ncbi:MAG: hypothetical protein IPO53_04215 [Chitinophagaceae bacterium]|nr:hypothetical protein [Chitinophagaceae bacterium]
MPPNCCDRAGSATIPDKTRQQPIIISFRIAVDILGEVTEEKQIAIIPNYIVCFSVYNALKNFPEMVSLQYGGRPEYH